MPGLVRKLIIFAAADGLILQAHGTTDHHKILKIDYRSRELEFWKSNPNSSHKSLPHIETHGVIGLLPIASLSYLIAITQREQVAQVFGKPIYVIKDVALIPVTSQKDAIKAINDASSLTRPDGSLDSESNSSSESDAGESDLAPESLTSVEAPSPPDEERLSLERNLSSTSVAADVIVTGGQYGRFASQWFSKRSWQPQTPAAVSRIAAEIAASEPTTSSANTVGGGASGHVSPSSTISGKTSNSASGEQSTIALLPKILRSARLILSSRSFYFSYDINITRRLGSSGLQDIKIPFQDTFNSLYFWNRHLGQSFLQSGNESFLIPVMQGFVGQRSFVVKSHKKSCGQTPFAAEALKASEENVTAQNESEEQLSSDTKDDETISQPFLLTLISRRSVKRSGLRYLRRGIDDQGNCANTVETEQILSSPTWEVGAKMRSFVQIRGSIPLYFSQSPYAFKPIPVLHHSAATNKTAFRRHFEGLWKTYGDVHIALLVDRHGGEVTIGSAYEEAVKRANEAENAKKLGFEWFDFHAECRGMKFENVERLVKVLTNPIMSFGETVIEDGKLVHPQTGIIRTNCMDCLDRTNVAQSAFGQLLLQQNLNEEGFEIDLLHDESTQWFNSLWADNGDAISRQYASTAALKGDFTRTRKRNYRGALNDLGLTLSRYYNNMVNDYFSQATIDVLLGNVSWKVFEDFESNMMSADPGISIENVRQTAIDTCAKIVIQEAEEDLIHGWTLLTPAHANTLRTLPFQESVILLTEVALYSCKFDWNTEKVASFEKVELHSISKIHYGTYITSTLTERQMDEQLNVGLVVLYDPAKGSHVRVNTRSLQNYVAAGPTETTTATADSGSGILMSWLTLSRQSTSTTQMMALKVIPTGANPDDYSAKAMSADSPIAVAEHIAVEIQRAIMSSTERGDEIAAPAAAAAVAADCVVEKGEIISLAEAKKRTGYFEHLGHAVKKFVWT